MNDLLILLIINYVLALLLIIEIMIKGFNHEEGFSYYIIIIFLIPFAVLCLMIFILFYAIFKLLGDLIKYLFRR